LTSPDPEKNDASVLKVGTSSFAASHISHAAGIHRHRSIHSLSPEGPQERLLPQLDFLPTAVGVPAGRDVAFPPRADRLLPSKPSARASIKPHRAAPVESGEGEGEDSGGDIEIVMPDDEPDETVSPQESRAEALPPPPNPMAARQLPPLPIKPGENSKQTTHEISGGVQAGARGSEPVGRPVAGAAGGGKVAGAGASAPRVTWSKDAAKGAMAGQVEEAPIVKVR
jgi:hypothetical protein